MHTRNSSYVTECLEDAIRAGAPDYSVAITKSGTTVIYTPADLSDLIRWVLAQPEAAERLASALEGGA